jgi:hypothetical protein
MKIAIRMVETKIDTGVAIFSWKNNDSGSQNSGGCGIAVGVQF